MNKDFRWLIYGLQGSSPCTATTLFPIFLTTYKSQYHEYYGAQGERRGLSK